MIFDLSGLSGLVEDNATTMERRLVGGCADNIIPDDAITASSYATVDGERNLSGKGEMWRSRLDNDESTSWMGGDDCAYVEWDLGAVKKVEAVQTKGCAVLVPNYKIDRLKGVPQRFAWVNGYRLSYEVDSEWITHPQFFNGNEDADTLVENGVEPPICCRRIRLHPMDSNYRVAMRVEFLGEHDPMDIALHPMQRALLDDIFDNFDADKDGVISQTEAEDGMIRWQAALGKSMDTEQAFEMWSGLFNEVGGIGNNGSVSRSLWHERSLNTKRNFKGSYPTDIAMMQGESMLTALQEGNGTNASQALIRSLFDVYDQNGDGKISQDELTQIMRTLNPKLADADVHEMFQAADANSDGAIDVEEFLAWVFSSTRGGYPDVVMEVVQAIERGDVEALEISVKKWASDVNSDFIGSIAKCLKFCEGVSNMTRRTCGVLDKEKDLLVEAAGVPISRYSYGDDFLAYARHPDIVKRAASIMQAYFDMVMSLQTHLGHPLASFGTSGAFGKTACGVAHEFIRRASRVDATQFKIALMQVRQLGFCGEVLRKIVGPSAHDHDVLCNRLGTVQLPRYWDMSAMQEIEGAAGIELSQGDDINLVARVEISREEVEIFQELFDSTFIKIYTRDRRKGDVPDRLIVVRGERIQNFHNFVEFYKRQQVIAKELSEANITQLCKSHMVFRQVYKHGLWEETQRWEPDPEDMGPMTMRLSEHLRNYNEENDDGYVDKPSNTHWFFHGTNETAAKAITDGDFLINLAGTNAGTLYGKGVYLAEACSKSDEYTQENADGTRCLLVCRGTLGLVNYTDARKPDPDALVDSCVNGVYHSVLGDRQKCRGTFREYIIYDDNQVYPEFIIYYKRKYNKDVETPGQEEADDDDFVDAEAQAAEGDPEAAAAEVQ